MAATAVYFRACRIPMGDHVRVFDSHVETNISATTDPFQLLGGKYGLHTKASTYGTVTLQVLLPDNTTYGTAATAFSADGYSTADLAPGTYRVLIA